MKTKQRTDNHWDEPSDRERRIEAGYRRLLRAVLDGKAKVQRAKAKVQSPASAECGVQNAESGVQGSKFGVRRSKFNPRHPAAEVYLSRFLCVGFALALAVTGCVGPRPLKGGKAVVTRTPGGSVQQTLTQSENPAQATKQDQETIKVRTYTVPAGSRIEQAQMWEGERPREPKLPGTTGDVRARRDAGLPGQRPPSTLPPSPLGYGGQGNPPLSTSIALSAPMQVMEREETRERTELGAAQKDMAREVGAKLASLKGIVWVGVGLFIFGLASLVYPPLKVIIGSVTTSAAVVAGGLCLMVLPNLIVGNELLILGGVAVAVGGWFLAHRHGQLSGIVAASTNASGGRASPQAQTPQSTAPASPAAIVNPQANS